MIVDTTSIILCDVAVIENPKISRGYLSVNSTKKKMSSIISFAKKPARKNAMICFDSFFIK